MTTTKRLFALFLLLLGVAGGTAACENTVRGVGEDLRGTGDAIGDQTRPR